MKRRHFLNATVVGGAALMWPSWLRQAFGDGAKCDASGKPMVQAIAQSAAEASQAFRNARRAGRPLLVIVIPPDDEKYSRGQAWGELLNFGTDQQLAVLSSVEVVCATMDALKLIVPNDVSGVPFFAVVATDKTPPSVGGFNVQLPGYRDIDRPGKYTWEQRVRDEDDTSRRRIEVLANALRSALGAPSGDLAARAADVRTRLKNQAPAGTHWAKSSGCGVKVEGADDNMVIGCGMGHVPAKSQRFLYFFTRQRHEP